MLLFLKLVFLSWVIMYAHAQWTTASLSQPRQSLAATSIGNLAFFAGGSQNSDRVDVYNASSNTWQTAALSQGREDLSAATVGKLALFVGGTTEGASRTNRVDVYNASQNAWSTDTLCCVEFGSAEIAGLTSTTLPNLAFFTGGASIYSSVSGKGVFIFNATSNAWSTEYLSEARHYLAATSIGSLALFAGGEVHPFGGELPYFSQTVDIYNATAHAWSTASLSEARGFLAATSVGNFALFAGGLTGPYENHTASAVVDIYDVKSNTWSTASLSEERIGLVATSVGNLALFAGGYIGDFTKIHSDVVDIYNASSNTWTIAKLSHARSGLAAITVKNLALFGGGFSGPGYNLLDVVDIYQAPDSIFVDTTDKTTEDSTASNGETTSTRDYSIPDESQENVSMGSVMICGNQFNWCAKYPNIFLGMLINILVMGSFF